MNPPFADSLREALASAAFPFRWFAPEERAGITQALLESYDQYPFGEELQTQGQARIQRAVPLATGPSRAVRLTQNEHPLVLLADPEVPDRVFAALGPNLPPHFWPSAEPTRAGIERDLAAYLSRPFQSFHRFTRSLRLSRGTLGEIGLEGLDQLVRILSVTEQWLDGEAAWGSASVEDPWPEDPSTASFLTLRAIGMNAAEQHPNRWQTVSLRTLWSRSILRIERGPFDGIVFELRYDPAPFVAPMPNDEERDFPDDIPVDLLASLLRASSVLPSTLERLSAEPNTPSRAFVSCLLDPAETTTFELLAKMVRDPDPELREAGISLALGFGARGVLYELECETEDEALRARIREATRLSPREEAPTEDESEDDDDEDWDDEGDDEDWDDEEDDESSEEEES